MAVQVVTSDKIPEVVERLFQAITFRDISTTDIQEKIGISGTSLYKWRNGDVKTIRVKTLKIFADKLNINLDWLLTGEGGMTDDLLETNVIVEPEEQTIDNPEFIQIPEYNVTFGAGQTQEARWDEVEDARPATYRRDFFTSRGVKPENCVRLHVTGDSMSPIINPGDCITIDRDVLGKPIHSGKIYAVAFDHQLMVKRLNLFLDRLELASENPERPTIVLRGEEMNRISVLGYVLDRSGSVNN